MGWRVVFVVGVILPISGPTWAAQNPSTKFVMLCYTRFVVKAVLKKNVTITMSEEAAHWARMKAAEENTSVSRLVGKLIETQMQQSDEYWEAYRKWQKMEAFDMDAATRLTRDEAHARR